MQRVVVKKITVKTPIIELDNEFKFQNHEVKFSEPDPPPSPTPAKGLRLVQESWLSKLSTINLDDFGPPRESTGTGRLFSMLQTNSFVTSNLPTKTTKVFKRKRSKTRDNKVSASAIFDLEAAAQMPSHLPWTANSPTVSSYMRRQKVLSERITKKLSRFKSVQNLSSHKSRQNISYTSQKRHRINPAIERVENGSYVYKDAVSKHKKFTQNLRERLKTPVRANSAARLSEFSPARRTWGNFHFPKKEKQS